VLELANNAEEKSSLQRSKPSHLFTVLGHTEEHGLQVYMKTEIQL
jgi:hypothetical protein